ncbi:MAG: hypothetical protein ACJ74V_09475, partial [Gaiellaceae bacterium]
ARASFVRRVNGTWVNVAAAGDPIGRTVFGGSPMPWVAEGRQELPGAPKLVDVQLGRGGHSSYWKSRALYLELKRLIEEPLAPAAPTAPGAHRPQDVAAGV